MRIGINGNEANVAHRVGSGQYVFELLTHLSKLQDSSINFEIYLSDLPKSDLPKPTSNWKYKTFGPHKLWTLTGLQNKLVAEKVQGKIPEVFFTPTHYSPLYVPTKSVISIMDMSFEDLPQFFKKRDLLQLRYWTKISALRAKKIITISQFSKDQICKTYNISPQKVVVTHLGFDSDRFNMTVSPKSPKISTLVKKYHLDDGYFLFLGTLQPKKNIERLIEAFARLPRKNLKLAVVGMINEGRGGWMNQSIFDIVKKLGVEDRVVFTGYVPDDDLPPLFKGSLAFVLPSLYEGFGIPPIEAMATGVPVVISKVGSLFEVCGSQAPIYIDDPYSVDSIQSALQKILDMKAEELVKRVDLGVNWVKRYNWHSTAKLTLETLKSI